MASGIPSPSEYNAYYQGYVSQVNSPDITSFLNDKSAQHISYYETIPDSSWDHSYAPGKWSIKGVLQHIIDTERIFSCRLLRISRGDTTPMPGFDQNEYADNLDLSLRSKEDLIAEFKAVRQATLTQLSGIKEEDWQKMGTASDSPVSVRALAYLIAGHELHHLQILREKYMV